MSAISTSYNSPFGITGELGEGTASILGANASATPNAATVTAAGQTDTSSPFYALSQALSADKTPTIEALQTGKLTTAQHNVLAAISANGNKPTSLPWNANGSEPTVIATIRGYGWIKLVEPDYDSATRLTASATYELTAVGQAIAKRTGGSGVSSTGANVLA